MHIKEINILPLFLFTKSLIKIVNIRHYFFSVIIKNIPNEKIQTFPYINFFQYFILIT